MHPNEARRRRTPGAVLAFFAALAACTPEPDDLREWSPADHRHQAQSGAQAPQVSGSAEAPLPGLEEVTIAAWRRNCTSCHGQLGRGDGPQGAMTRAKDLSDPAWQTSVTDAQIGESIVRGRGAMPGFPLPESTVTGLVRLVRLLNRDRLASPAGSAPSAPSAAGSAAPPASAPNPVPSVR